MFTINIKTMTYAKKEVFDTELQEISVFAKVLSHPARLAGSQTQCSI